MFSLEQKKQISAAVEKVLLDINHPEMQKEKPRFCLHVDGADSESWANIYPNHTFDDQNMPGTNPHNEAVAAQMDKKDHE